MMAEILEPSVTALRPPETILVPFTDYSRWERKHSKGSAIGIHVRTQQQAAARTVAPLSTPRLRKSSKSTAPEAKSRQRSNQQAPSTSTSTAHVRLQPVAFVCNHGQGIRRRSATKFSGASVASSGDSRVKGRGQQVSISPGKQHKTGRLGRSHEPTNIRLLRLQLAARRSSVGEYLNYRDQLLADNISIVTSIQQLEEHTNTKMNRLLEKYQKFKGAITTLKEKSAQQMKAASEDLEQTRTRLQAEISKLRSRVSNMDTTVQLQSRELYILLHYKEKEYPIRMVRMEQLREQGELEEERQSAEVADLEDQMDEEWSKYEQQLDAVKRRLEARATEASLSKLKRSVHQKAIQNRIMEKELLIHKQKKEELTESIQVLKVDIKQLRTAIKEHSAMSTIRPRLPSREKCLPDTEFQLNIPVQEYLPV